MVLLISDRGIQEDGVIHDLKREPKPIPDWQLSALASDLPADLKKACGPKGCPILSFIVGKHSNPPYLDGILDCHILYL